MFYFFTILLCQILLISGHLFSSLAFPDSNVLSIISDPNKLLKAYCDLRIHWNLCHIAVYGNRYSPDNT